MKLAYLDFEFNGISEPKLNLVSCAVVCTDGGVLTYTREFWLYEGKQSKEASAFFFEILRQGYIFCAYVMEAETRSLLSLLPTATWLKNFYCIDIYLEYRCLLNRCDEMSYGEQYLNGKVIETTPPPPKWVKDETSKDEGSDPHHKPSYSLAAACFKLLGVKVDTVEKAEVRGIIIRGDRDEISASRERIQKYNLSDIDYLPKLLTKVCGRFAAYGVGKEDWLRGAYLRGDYAARTARMIISGYPVNQGKLEKFKQNIPAIIESSIKDCIESAEGFAPFRFNEKSKTYVCNTKAIKDWVLQQKNVYWRKTAGKALSLSKDAFSDWYDSNSPGFAGAYCRHLKTKQSLNGFLPTSAESGKSVFSDFVGKDGRVRPHFGIYGSQSSRSQPGSVGFIPLKAHWLRNFIEAPAGRAVAGVDYASQEFLIAAVISQDSKMMDAYSTGDVYMAFARAAKLVPPHATKATNPVEREMCKAAVLGISYDMTAKGLAPRMSRAAARVVTEQEAQVYIDEFFGVYCEYADWKSETTAEYEASGRLSLPDGWTMWGDNSNIRSVGNFPIQGHGAVIMREAVARAQDLGLDVIYTLHDALYIEFDSLDFKSIVDLRTCMQQAFQAVMGRYGKTLPIRLEGEAWSRDYLGTTGDVDGVTLMKEYIDDKGRKDLDRYRKFFT